MSNRTNGKLVIGVLLLGMFLVNATFAIAEPTVTLDPASPELQGEVTFTATVDDENIVGVFLEIQECDANLGICYPDTQQNLTMLEQTNGSAIYTATATLIRTDVTYLQYTLNVETSEGWVKYLEKTKVNLTLDQDDNGDTNGGTDNGSGTPGFEIILVMISLLVAVSLYKRKRMK